MENKCKKVAYFEDWNVSHTTTGKDQHKSGMSFLVEGHSSKFRPRTNQLTCLNCVWNQSTTTIHLFICQEIHIVFAQYMPWFQQHHTAKKALLSRALLSRALLSRPYYWPQRPHAQVGPRKIQLWNFTFSRLFWASFLPLFRPQKSFKLIVGLDISAD